MIDMRMHVSIGKKTEKMHCRMVFLDIRHQSFPSIRRKHFSIFYGFGNQLGALAENLTGPQRIMSHLAVSHLPVGQPHVKAGGLQLAEGILGKQVIQQAYRGAMRPQSEHRVITHQSVQRGRIGFMYRIRLCCRRKAYAIHHNGEHRSIYPSERIEFM